ncbi:hypothetical protein BJ508DRAFT_347357 [Ascobolus immersus RN42]|uniref:Uncharacterized protein n=1 Tax=Ascobolus immersus RN42 TaxID=1160509 RepID=A0A3N4I7J6_ASCIM|nr:hypothetical protein BJ508DRAFT_347357 [Ascobolus immersus RN42]
MSPLQSTLWTSAIPPTSISLQLQPIAQISPALQLQAPLWASSTVSPQSTDWISTLPTTILLQPADQILPTLQLQPPLQTSTTTAPAPLFTTWPWVPLPNGGIPPDDELWRIFGAAARHGLRDMLAIGEPPTGPLPHQPLISQIAEMAGNLRRHDYPFLVGTQDMIEDYWGLKVTPLAIYSWDYSTVVLCREGVWQLEDQDEGIRYLGKDDELVFGPWVAADFRSDSEVLSVLSGVHICKYIKHYSHETDLLD